MTGPSLPLCVCGCFVICWFRADVSWLRSLSTLGVLYCLFWLVVLSCVWGFLVDSSDVSLFLNLPVSLGSCRLLLGWLLCSFVCGFLVDRSYVSLFSNLPVSLGPSQRSTVLLQYDIATLALFISGCHGL